MKVKDLRDKLAGLSPDDEISMDMMIDPTCCLECFNQTGDFVIFSQGNCFNESRNVRIMSARDWEEYSNQEHVAQPILL